MKQKQYETPAPFVQFGGIKRKSMENNKLYAIWKYDMFPGFTGAPVDELQEEGLVKPEGYGGARFKYKKLYPLEEGKRLHAEAKRIAKIAEDEMFAIRQKALNDINKLMGLES